MKQTINRISLIISICLMAISCVPIKKMIYLQSENDFMDKVFEYNKADYRLQVNDIVDVQVRSMNDEANKLFLFKCKVQVKPHKRVFSQVGICTTCLGIQLTKMAI